MIGIVETEGEGEERREQQNRDKRLGVNREMQKHLVGGKWAG